MARHPFRELRTGGLAASAFLAATLLSSSGAQALISGGVSVGKEWQEQKYGDETAGLSGNQIQAHVMVDPIPFVPLAAGLNLRNTSFNKGLNGSSESTLRTISVEAMGWLPMVPVVTPYLKVGYNVFGALTTKGSIEAVGEVTLVEKVSGTRLALGVDYPFLPLISLVFEGSLMSEKSKFDSASLPAVLPAGASADDFKTTEGTLTSKAILIGAKVNF